MVIGIRYEIGSYVFNYKLTNNEVFRIVFVYTIKQFYSKMKL